VSRHRFATSNLNTLSFPRRRTLWHRLGLIFCFLLFLSSPIIWAEESTDSETNSNTHSKSNELPPPIDNTPIPGPDDTYNTPTEMKSGKIRIKQIRLEGDTLFPEYGITRDYLDETVAKVYAQMNGKLSMSDISRIADALTLAYRAKGLTFNQTFIVPQEISQSVLTLYILKGTLSEIDIINNSLYTQGQLLAPFELLIGRTIYEPDIMHAVEQANKKPGIKVFAFFSMGLKQGESRLNLRVLNEKKYNLTLLLDNKGVLQTGVLRGTGSMTINNPLKKSGQLKLTGLKTLVRGNWFVGSSYSIPFWEKHQGGSSFLYSNFSVAGKFADLGLSGSFFTASGFWSMVPPSKKNSRVHLMYSGAVAIKNSEVSSILFPEYVDTSIDYITLSGSYQRQFVDNFKIRGQHIFLLRPSFNSVSTWTLPSGREIDPDPLKPPSAFFTLRGTYQYLNLGWLTKKKTRHPFTAKFKFQLATDILPGAEKFSASGASANRGFKAGIYSGDNGFSLSLEQSINFRTSLTSILEPLGLQPFIFVDYSYASSEINTPISIIPASFILDSDRVVSGSTIGGEEADFIQTTYSASLLSTGIGLKADFQPKKVARGSADETFNLYFKSGSASITLGFPISHSFSDDLILEADSPIIQGHMNFNF